MSAVLQNLATERAIVHRTRGQTHGPITRLVSPSDLGEIIKPFVFLDLFEVPASREPLFGWHPHSGIATLTVVHEGAFSYEETTGQKGVLSTGGVEWIDAHRVSKGRLMDMSRTSSKPYWRVGAAIRSFGKNDLDSGCDSAHNIHEIRPASRR